MQKTNLLRFSTIVTAILFNGCTGANKEMLSHQQRADEFIRNDKTVLIGKIEENKKVADAVTIYPNQKLSSILRDLGVLQDRYYILQGKDFDVAGTRAFKIHSFEELNEYIKTVSNYEIDITKNKFVSSLPKIVEVKEQKINTILDRIEVSINKALTPNEVFYQNSQVMGMGWHMIDEADIKGKFNEKQTINFNGTLREFLEYFARNNDVFIDIEANKKEVVFKKYKTKHFPIKIPNQKITFSNDIATNIDDDSAYSSSSSSSKSGGSGSKQSSKQSGKINISNTYDVTESLKNLLQKIIPSNAEGEKNTNQQEYYQYFDATNELVVRAVPSRMETVEKVVENINSTALKMIALKVSIFEVTLSKDYQYGINWGYVNSKAVSSTNSIVTAINSAGATPSVDSALGTPSIFKYATTEGVNAVVNSLNDFGETTLSDQITVLATNNIATIINRINRQAYISSYSNTSTASVGSTATVEQSNAIGGKYVYLKPQIFNDKTFMSLKIIRAKVNKIEKQEFSDSQYVQTPNDDRDIISQDFTMQDGEKLVIGGFRDTTGSKGYNGMLPDGDNALSALVGTNQKVFKNKEIVLVIEAKEI